MFDSINKENLHHAYVLQGQMDGALPILEDFLVDRLGFDIQGNPDYSYRKYDTFGVDDARALSVDQMRKSISGGKKIFVLSFQGITIEAQNALLKVFEEPTEQTHFFIILDSFDRLIPTLRSRVFFVSKLEESPLEIKKIGKKFVSSPLCDRLTVIEDLHERKDKTAAKQLLSGIEVVLHDEVKKNPSAHLQNIIHEVLSAKGYLSDRSPSLKMLLEHIAHITPII